MSTRRIPQDQQARVFTWISIFILDSSGRLPTKLLASSGLLTSDWKGRISSFEYFVVKCYQRDEKIMSMLLRQLAALLVLPCIAARNFKQQIGADPLSLRLIPQILATIKRWRWVLARINLRHILWVALIWGQVGRSIVEPQ
jgi:hypothetical protein